MTAQSTATRAPARRSAAKKGAKAPKPQKPAKTLSEAPSAAKAPRTDTKSEKVLEMLRRPEGATGEQIATAMAWLPHTTRAFLTGLRKKGHAISKEEKVYRLTAA